MTLNKNEFKHNVLLFLKGEFGKTAATAKAEEKLTAVSRAVMELTAENREKTEKAYTGKRRASYFSAEYLMGRALGNNLINLGVYQDVKQALEELDIDLNLLEECEEDAGLGNGGLGRLAACFLDSAATLDLPLTGYGIRYHFGLFKQKFVDGFQKEEADHWMKNGDPWSVRCEDDAVLVEFADGPVKAVPYDTPISGYGTSNVNCLRLWQGEALFPFDFTQFNDQEYNKSVELKNRAEDISRVLYPNDDKEEGKILRLKQQYFFVSASLQDLIRRYKAEMGDDLKGFSKLNAIQLNDTHPAVAVAELMRLLMAEGLKWDEAWEVTRSSFAYTNHTILAEALEKWYIGTYRKVLPEVVGIIEKIDEQLAADLKKLKVKKKTAQAMRIIQDDMIHMARLSIYGSSFTNGVAALHTEILKESELNDWYKIYPERFQNKTNGITQRRWLVQSNPELTAFISELLGGDEWITDLYQLKKLEKWADDEIVMKRFLDIKREKKVQLAAYIKEVEGVDIDPDTLFDVQVKRLHEYKRQLLNAFHILDLYRRLKADPSLRIAPRTFIFGAKAAPGYARAKAVIKFINDIGELVNNDPDVKGKLKVIFVQNYRVSYAQKIFPAADLSEQISTAGKEASGTGNMKFMLNGAPTIGTFDGANVEIVEEAGEENNFIFGLGVEEIKRLAKKYDPKKPYLETEGLKASVDALIDITFDADESDKYFDLYEALLRGMDWHVPDHYYVLEDFDSYREAQKMVDQAYLDPMGWARKAWMNIANVGKFSSDRTIAQYADEIWKIESCKVK